MINYFLKNSKTKYIFISAISFTASLIFINIFTVITSNELFSAKLTIIFIFFMNLLMFLKFYDLKMKKFFFILLFSLTSFFFRIFEYSLFVLMFKFLENLNIAWIVSLVISFLLKFFVFDKLVGVKF